jgi:hypothetical protein
VALSLSWIRTPGTLTLADPGANAAVSYSSESLEPDDELYA